MTRFNALWGFHQRLETIELLLHELNNTRDLRIFDETKKA